MAQRDTLLEWDRKLLERRRRTTERTARHLLIGAAAATCAAGVSFAVDRSHPAWLGLFVLAAALVVAGMVCDLVAKHVFLLDPSRYGRWLRGVPPYEPATIWEQLGHGTTSRIGGTSGLVLGGLIGTYLGWQAGSSGMVIDAAVWIGYLVMLAAPLWWARFLVQLAVVHRRAIRQGILPVRSPGRFGLFWLFTALWVISIVAVGLVVWAMRLYLQVMYGVTIS